MGVVIVSNESAREVYKTHVAAQEKYRYFLLAAAGAAIGLAVSETRETTLAWSQLSLGAAVLCWASSFFFGCRHVEYAISILSANAELLWVQSGTHPKAGAHPQMINIASEVIRDVIESNNKSGSRFARWQFGFLVAGAVLYVSWHISEMYLRSIAH